MWKAKGEPARGYSGCSGKRCQWSGQGWWGQCVRRKSDSRCVLMVDYKGSPHNFDFEGVRVQE